MYASREPLTCTNARTFGVNTDSPYSESYSAIECIPLTVPTREPELEGPPLSQKAGTIRSSAARQWVEPGYKLAMMALSGVIFPPGCGSNRLSERFSVRPMGRLREPVRRVYGSFLASRQYAWMRRLALNGKAGMVSKRTSHSERLGCLSHFLGAVPSERLAPGIVLG